MGDIGVINDPAWIDLLPKSINIDQWGAAHVDRTGWIGVVHPYVDPLAACVTTTVPVDVEHWTAAGGITATGMEHWQSCLTLMTRL